MFSINFSVYCRASAFFVFVCFFQVVKVMSWLSDHLFGVPKSKDENNKDADESATAESSEPPQPAPPPPSSGDAAASAEIQNTAITTSADTTSEDAAAAYENRDVVAEWQVPVRGQLHQLEFEHGTTSGKRILWVNGQVGIHCRYLIACFSLLGILNFSSGFSFRSQEVFHRDWMFKLVGDDTFELDGLRCVLRVRPPFKIKKEIIF